MAREERLGYSPAAGGPVAGHVPKQCVLIKHTGFSRMVFALFFQIKGIGGQPVVPHRQLRVVVVDFACWIKVKFSYK